MNNFDDNDDLDRTMLIPNPGGRRSTQSNYTTDTNTTPPPSVFNQTLSSNSTEHKAFEFEAENKLLAYAAELINLASNLRTLEPNNSVDQLRHEIEGQISQFETRLQNANLSPEIAMTARYILCCLIDELVLTTPWGIESNWSRQTLLSKYHNETSGGEKFFVIVNKIMEQPQRNIDLIELCYLCLSIGFRGKYRLSTTGETDIVQLCMMMHQAISLHRPVSQELSPSWRVPDANKPSIEKRVPPSLLFSILAFVCISVYIGFLSNLHAKSAPLFAKIESIGWDQSFNLSAPDSSSTVANSPNKTAENRLNALFTDIQQRLGSATAQGLVELVRQPDFVIVRFIHPQLFRSGSVSVDPAFLPNLDSVLSAIEGHSNSVVIVGHTDSTGRAESNWVISRQRAESIEAWLKSGRRPLFQTATRGVADTQALTANKEDSRNRRVEILIFVDAGK